MCCADSWLFDRFLRLKYGRKWSCGMWCTFPPRPHNARLFLLCSGRHQFARRAFPLSPASFALLPFPLIFVLFLPPFFFSSLLFLHLITSFCVQIHYKSLQKHLIFYFERRVFPRQVAVKSSAIRTFLAILHQLTIPLFLPVSFSPPNFFPPN